MEIDSVQRPLVITGATGFVGSHVLKKLNGQDRRVFALTRSQKIPAQSEHVTWIHCSDFAAFVPPDNSTLLHIGEPSHVAEVEALGMSHLLSMQQNAKNLLRQKYEHAIYASSATVYGDQEAHPRKPDEATDSQHKNYAQAKLAVENLFLEKNGAVARITNTYGFGMMSSNIVSDILNQLGKSGPLYLRETTPVRDYLYVEDLACGLVEMSKSHRAGIFNLATGRAISCGDLARLSLSISGESDREVIGKLPDRHSVLKLDISETLSTFNWRPQISLEEGISMLINGNEAR